jgi:two-component sensor histidine kinase
MISLTGLLPVIIMSIGIFISIQRGINDTVIQRNQLLAKSIALSIEQQIRDATILLISTTEQVDAINDVEYKKFMEASLVSSGIYESFYAINEQGRVIYSIPQNDVFTGFDFSQQTVIRQVMNRSTPAPAYSSAFISTQTKNPTIVVAVHQPYGIYAGYLNLTWLSRLSKSLESEQITSLSIVDRYGTTIANRNRALVEEQYSIANTELFAWAQKSGTGTLHHRFENNDVITSVNFIPGPNWYVFISEPTKSAFRASRDVLFIGLMVAVFAIIGAILVGYTLGRSILVSIQLLTEESQQVQAGVYRDIQHAGNYAEINRLIETFNAMSDEIQKREIQYEEANRQLEHSLQQKEILLKEIHHRVKNNMQIVSSLLSLQADELVCEEDREFFENSRLRIQSMAMVHEKIYQTQDLESLPLKDYLQDLVELIIANNQTFMEYAVTGDAPIISLNQAIPCALSVFEACMNAIKYGKDNDGYVKLAIAIQQEEQNWVRIIVKDAGPGFPADFAPAKSRSLGFTLMLGLMDQLKGTLRWYNDAGAVVEFLFQLG